MDTVTIGHNRTATADAEDLLDTFERAPEVLDESAAQAAITLAKQMKLEIDGLFVDRREDNAELRERLVDAERPYNLALERLGEARGKLIARLGDYLKATGRPTLKNALGLQVYSKRRLGFQIEDQAKLPAAFTRAVPDEAMIEAALKRGETVPGVKRVETITFVVV